MGADPRKLSFVPYGIKKENFFNLEPKVQKGKSFICWGNRFEKRYTLFCNGLQDSS